MSLADRVAAHLAEGRAATVPEIARAVRARDVDVRELVTNDPRFALRPTPAGRPGQARCYALVEEPVPPRGTSSPADTAPPPSWWLPDRNAPRSVGEAVRAAGPERRAA